ncbi:dienelactone hydrolase family protein [Chitinibacter sp. SCUT-21]|uniref:dienelactone hydrolase family protein n=1 Tax=Chitinibacter sp. SCUT-21 TaxID=2970891 RepID=UPI0035A6B759
MPYFGLILFCLASVTWAVPTSLQLGSSRLKAEYFSSSRPHSPAVVLMHGCAGLLDSNKELAIRYARMTSQLQELDFAVLLLNDKAAGKKPCAISSSKKQKAEMKRRAKNLQTAISWLKKRKEIDSNRIAVVGWDSGATATLWLLNQAKPGLRSATVFYPNCRLLLGADFRVSAPTLLLAGQRDGLAPLSSCSELSQISGQSLFHLVSYPDAMHDFDLVLDNLESEALNLPPNHLPLEDIADPVAAQDAWRRTYKWLSRWFDPERSMEGIPPRRLQ